MSILPLDVVFQNLLYENELVEMFEALSADRLEQQAHLVAIHIFYQTLVRWTDGGFQALVNLGWMNSRFVLAVD